MTYSLNVEPQDKLFEVFVVCRFVLPPFLDDPEKIKILFLELFLPNNEIYGTDHKWSEHPPPGYESPCWVSLLPEEEAGVQVRQNVEQAQKYVEEKKFQDLEHPGRLDNLLLTLLEGNRDRGMNHYFFSVLLHSLYAIKRKYTFGTLKWIC